MLETVRRTVDRRIDAHACLLIRLTVQAKDFEQAKTESDAHAASDHKSKDIFSLLSHAQEKFQDTVNCLSL